MNTVCDRHKTTQKRYHYNILSKQEYIVYICHLIFILFCSFTLSTDKTDIVIATSSIEIFILILGHKKWTELFEAWIKRKWFLFGDCFLPSFMKREYTMQFAICWLMTMSSGWIINIDLHFTIIAPQLSIMLEVSSDIPHPLPPHHSWLLLWLATFLDRGPHVSYGIRYTCVHMVLNAEVWLDTKSFKIIGHLLLAFLGSNCFYFLDLLPIESMLESMDLRISFLNILVTFSHMINCGWMDACEWK